MHRAARSDRLVAALADVLATPLDDPLTTEVVSVHSRGIERWIAQELSARLGVGVLGDDGVAADLDFPFPGRLIRTAVARGSHIDPERDPWLPERLTWPLLELVDEDPDAAMLGPLRAHVGGGGDPQAIDGVSRRFGAVRHVADLFDRYGVHRPDMLVAWRDGDPVGPDGQVLAGRQRWQADLWHAVRKRLGVPSFAERHQTALPALVEDPGLLDLPPRFALFGLTSLPAAYLQVLTAIARHRDVHLLLLHPSPALWDRVAAIPRTPDQPLPLRDHDPTATLARNPLLRSWGRDARELQLIAPTPDDPTLRHHHPADDDLPRTLLERIQADIRADRTPDGDASLDHDDRSVQVHDCHGRLRQVEVVRDAILHLLADAPDLEPRDIIVMCPDIEHFAPLVTAVFGAEAVTRDDGPHAAADSPPALRVRLADRSLRRTNPVLEVVSEVLGLVDGRVTASAVLDLISREPVRRRFRFDDDEVEVLESWVTDLQIRWGLDGDHRTRHGLPPLEQNTWRAGLQRLQLGIAMADEQLRIVGGIAPFDDVEGRLSDLAGRLVELVTRLGVTLAAMAEPRPIDAWRDAIGAAADALTVVDRAHAWQRLQLHRVLDELVDEATTPRGVSPVEVALAEVRVMLGDRLAGRPSITSHRTGDLTISTLVPMRSVPHRVVCLMGLDDGAFPRQTVPDSDDLLLVAPRVGDRDPRSEDRQLLLDALLAATETLVVTYAGRDERTNEARPPAVPVDELLDVVDRTVAAQDGRPRDHVTIVHPLAEHDHRNFERGRLRPDAPWGFHPAALAAARAQRGAAQPQRAFLTESLPPLDGDVIDLDDLVAFLQHPVKAFVRQRLDVTLTTEGDEPSDAIPSTLKGLGEWKVGNEILQQWLAGADPARGVEMLRARGMIPPGDIADDDLARIHERIDKILLLCDKRGVAPGRRRTVDVEVALPDGRLLSGTIPDVAADTTRIQTVGYSRVAPKHRLAAWARYLAVTAHAPDQPWEAVTIGRYSGWKRGLGAQANILNPVAGDEQDVRAYVTRQLQRLVDLYDRGMRAPLPLYCATSAKIAQNLHDERDAVGFVDREWQTKERPGAFDLEDRDPYHLLVLGGQVPTEDLFRAICNPDETGWAADDRRVVAYAWRLWQPILDVERQAAA